MVRVSSDARIGAWLLASFLLLLFPFLSWLKMPPGERAIAPDTPMDRVSGALSEEWLFLWHAKGAVPRKAAFSVLASERPREMNLFMMAIGLYPYARPVPASYFGGDVPSQDREGPDYLLVFRCEVPPPPGFRLIQTNPGGCVFKRNSEVS